MLVTNKSIQPNPVKIEMFCTGRDSLKNGEPPALMNGEQSENERAHGNRSSNRTADRIATKLPPLESPQAGDSPALVNRSLKLRTDRAPHVQARSIRPMIIDGMRNECRRRSIDDDDEAIAIVAAGLVRWYGTMALIVWFYIGTYWTHHPKLLDTKQPSYAQPRTKEFCSLFFGLRAFAQTVEAVLEKYNGDDRPSEQPGHLHLRGNLERIYCTRRTVQDELLQYGMQYAMWNIAMNAVSVCDIFFDSNPLTLNGRGVTQEYAFKVCVMHNGICNGIWMWNTLGYCVG